MGEPRADNMNTFCELRAGRDLYQPPSMLGYLLTEATAEANWHEW
jgi:hypothetical protein